MISIHPASLVKSIVERLAVIIRLTGWLKYKYTDICVNRIVKLNDIRTNHKQHDFLCDFGAVNCATLESNSRPTSTGAGLNNHQATEWVIAATRFYAEQMSGARNWTQLKHTNILGLLSKVIPYHHWTHERVT